MGKANCSCIIREVDMINGGKMHEVMSGRSPFYSSPDGQRRL